MDYKYLFLNEHEIFYDMYCNLIVTLYKFADNSTPQIILVTIKSGFSKYFRWVKEWLSRFGIKDTCCFINGNTSGSSARGRFRCYPQDNDVLLCSNFICIILQRFKEIWYNCIRNQRQTGIEICSTLIKYRHWFRHGCPVGFILLILCLPRSIHDTRCVSCNCLLLFYDRIRWKNTE